MNDRDFAPAVDWERNQTHAGTDRHGRLFRQFRLDEPAAYGGIHG